jgi:hypothetical protein
MKCVKVDLIGKMRSAAIGLTEFTLYFVSLFTYNYKSRLVARYFIRGEEYKIQRYLWDFKFSRRRVWCSELSSGLYCRVKLSTDVSDVRTASIIRDEWYFSYAFYLLTLS